MDLKYIIIKHFIFNSPTKKNVIIMDGLKTGLPCSNQQ